MVDPTEDVNHLHGRRRLSWWIHLVALLVLALATLIRFYPYLGADRTLGDERIYLRSFQSVADNQSPYGPPTDRLNYYYPPAFAFLGALTLEATDSRTTVIAMRAFNVFGLALCLWISFLFVPRTWPWCLSIGVVYIGVAPIALTRGFIQGNVSFAAVGLSLAALALWRRHPLLAGLSFGVSTITKPLAPLAMVTLAGHRPARGGWRHLLAAATGVAVAGALTYISPFFGDYLATDGGEIGEWPLRRTVSLYRWLHAAGLRPSPLVLVAIVAVAVTLFVRRRPITERQVFLLAIATMTLGTPALWSHTMQLTLPLQVMAFDRAWRRAADRSPDAPPLARYELALVILAVIALQGSDGIGAGVEVGHALLQMSVLAVPVCAPLALAAYVWHDETSVSPVF